MIQGDGHDTESPAIRLLAQHVAPAIDGSEVRPLSSDSSQAPFPAAGSAASSRNSRSTSRSNYLTSAQWTADGTTLIATSSSQTVSSFVLPADLLQTPGQPQPLSPQTTLKLPEPSAVVAPSPYYSLADPSSQLLLIGCRDHPLQLHQVSSSSSSSPLRSYNLIKRESEAYITPSSLLWTPPGTHFIVGSPSRIDYFDLSRHASDGPLLTIPTIPSRRHISKGHGVGMKGTVAALSLSPADASAAPLLAAGTWTRWMGLYDLHRSDRVVANWSVAGADHASFNVDLGGQGIVQTAWSPCGRYLLVNERHAQGLLVYDIRVSGQLLAVLTGRPARSQQRLRCDVFPAQDGFEVWAGDQDGSVAVWEGVGSRNDVVGPTWSWAAHESPVGSTVLHPSGSVVATCSGGWEHLSVDDLDRHQSDGLGAGSRVLDESSLKVWSIGDATTE